MLKACLLAYKNCAVLVYSKSTTFLWSWNNILYYSKGSSTASRISGPYMYPDNISDWPQLHGDSGDDDDLYIELVNTTVLS